MTADHKRRYWLAAGLIILGFACAALSTGTIGGALATIFVALGMLLFLVFLFRDLGLTIDSRSRRRVPDPPRDGSGHANGPHDAPHVEAPRTADGGRSRVPVRRPDRLRDQHR